jgi:hypothetical protein
MIGDGERLKIEIAEGYGDDQKIDDGGIEARGRIGFGPNDKPPDDEKDDTAENEDGHDVYEQGKEPAHAGSAEEIEAVDKPLQRMIEGHGVEGEGAVKNENMHEACEDTLSTDGAPLEEDLDEGIDGPAEDSASPLLRLPSSQNLEAEINRIEKRGHGHQDEEGEQDFFAGRQHGGLLFIKKGRRFPR